MDNPQNGTQSAMPLGVFFQEFESVSGEAIGVHDLLSEEQRRIGVPAQAVAALKKLITREGAKSDPDISDTIKTRVHSEIKTQRNAAARALGFSQEELLQMDSFGVNSPEAFEYVAKIVTAREGKKSSASEVQQIADRDAQIAAKDKHVEQLQAKIVAQANQFHADRHRDLVDVELRNVINALPTTGVEKTAANKMLKNELNDFLQQRGAAVDLVNGELKLVNTVDTALDILDSSTGKPLTLELALITVAKNAAIYTIPKTMPAVNPNGNPATGNGLPSATTGGTPPPPAPPILDNGQDRLNNEKWAKMSALMLRNQKNNPEAKIPTFLQTQAR